MVFSRSERQWQILISEYKTCMQKLQSKRDAHKIILKLLSERETERDNLEKKLKSLNTAATEFLSKKDEKPQLEKFGLSKEGPSTVQGLVLLINKLQADVDLKREQLNELHTTSTELRKDLKALRSDKSGFNRVLSPNTEQPEIRDNFLALIQSLKQEVELSTVKIKTLTDEGTDLRLEREFYKQKLDSATEQLLQKNECQPIADIEELLEENRHLREKVDKLQHINAALVQHNTQPPRPDTRHTVSLHTRASFPGSAIKKRKNKHFPCPGRSKHVTFGSEDLHEEGQYAEFVAKHEEGQYGQFVAKLRDKVRVETELHHLQKLICDMQKVSNGLAETVLDKNTALNHQRASNRLLGERVCELEAKLRTLEMSGFWNVPESFGDEEGSKREVSKREVLRRLTISSETCHRGSGVSDELPLLVDTCELSVSQEHVLQAEASSSSSSSSSPFRQCTSPNMPIYGSQVTVSPDKGAGCPNDDEHDEFSSLLLSSPTAPRGVGGETPPPPHYRTPLVSDSVDLLPVREEHNNNNNNNSKSYFVE